MARTKRNTPVSSPSQAIWRAALYTRLSHEDGDKLESDSIANQRTLLEDFAARQPDLRVQRRWLHRNQLPAPGFSADDY